MAAGSCSHGKYSSMCVCLVFLRSLLVLITTGINPPISADHHLRLNVTWPNPRHHDTVGRSLLSIDALLIKGAGESESKDVGITERSERLAHVSVMSRWRHSYPELQEDSCLYIGAVLTNLHTASALQSRHRGAHLNSDLPLPATGGEAAGNRLITLRHFYRLWHLLAQRLQAQGRLYTPLPARRDINRKWHAF